LPTLELVLNQPLGRWVAPGPVYRVPPPLTWRQLRDQVRAQAPLLTAPQPGAPGLCTVCRGPAARGSAFCFQCDLHHQCASGGLAATVVPVAFAVKGGPHATNLWQYKSERRAVADPAAGTLLALLLVFLRDHGACVWRSAGISGPTHLAVVPTARGRPGRHPLRALIAPYLAGPWAELSPVHGGHPVRDLDPARFAASPLRGARVLLLDDTWTTGSTAQSAALALRRAGAGSVVIVVLGRHLGTARDIARAAMPFGQDRCAVHDTGHAQLHGGGDVG
jgi:hypothetical protein